MKNKLFCIKNQILYIFGCPICLRSRHIPHRGTVIVPTALTDEIRFEESRIQINPQSGTNTKAIITDRAAKVVD